MKKLLSLFVLILISALSAYSLTLKEAYEKIKRLPDLEGVESVNSEIFLGSGIGFIPFEDVCITEKINQGNGKQTLFYGNKLTEIQNQVPRDLLILGGEDYQNTVLFFAKPIDNNYSELLIMIAQAYQGKTTAAYGKVRNWVIEMLNISEVVFTLDHKIIVNTPIAIID